MEHLDYAYTSQCKWLQGVVDILPIFVPRLKKRITRRVIMFVDHTFLLTGAVSTYTVPGQSCLICLCMHRGKVWVACSFASRADQALECDPTMHESSLAGRSDRPIHGTHQLPRSRHQPEKKSFSSVHTVGPTI